MKNIKITISMISLLLALVLCLSGCGKAPVETGGDDLIDGEEFFNVAVTEVSAWKVGEKTTIAGYSFTAVAVEKDSTLLVCDASVKTAAFNDTFANSVLWKDCSLRTWLNGEFLNTLKADTTFNSSLLVTGTVVTEKSHVTGVVGCTTEDTVFIPSMEEVETYGIPGIGTDCWLRTAGEQTTHATVQKADGSIHVTGYRVDYPVAGVRPCIRIKANNAIASDTVSLSAAQVGSKVAFGNYGDGAIEWDVLAVSGGKALIMTDKVIDAVQFNAVNDTSVTYANSALAAWLNGEFKTVAFSAEELAKIDTAANVVTPANPVYGTAGGADSTGIFVLSIQEYRQYCTTDNTKLAGVTNTARENGVSEDAYSKTSGYWLRTMGKDASHVSYVMYYGDVSEDGVWQVTQYVGVRPAMWVTIG